MKNNNAQGILFILLGMFIFAIQDTLMKYIIASVALYEVYLIRTFVSLLVIVFYLKITDKPIIFKTHYPILTFCRIILFFAGFSFFYISLTIMPLATANALFFCSPFLITIFAKFILKEQVGIRRWTAVIIGFVGVMIILNPDFSNFDYLSTLPILCAFCYALSMIIIKKTSDKDNVYSQSLQFNAAAVIISLTFYFFIGDGQYDNINHPASQYILREWFGNLEFTLPFMVIMGFSAALAFLSLFTAYRISSAAVISPFEYSILVWTSLSGWFFFDEIPSIRVFIGMFFIVSAGIYIFMREKAQDQSIATEKPLR